MPYAVTHVLTAIIVTDLIRHHFLDKKKWPIYTILVAGIAGLVADLDVVAYYILHFTHGLDVFQVHRLFTHNIFIPLLTLILALIFFQFKKTKKPARYLTFITIGLSLHLLLDAIVMGQIALFWPITNTVIGLNLLPPTNFGLAVIQGIDAVILILWLSYVVYRHKLNDFI